MRITKIVVPVLALASAFPAPAAEPAADPQQQLAELKARVGALEKTLQVVTAGKSVATPGAPTTPGMTPEQEAEFNRIKIKAEALEDSRDANGFKNLKFSGYADPVYLWNKNRDRSGFQFLVPSTRRGEGYAYDNSYLGSFALDLVKETDSGTKFHVTLVPVRSIGEFLGGASIVHEASVWIPLGGSTKLFAGQIPDWSGYEMLQPTLNKLITHNLLFDTTLPYEYTGAGVDLLLGKWDLKLMLANFNQPARNFGEHKPMFVTRGDYSGGEFWGIGFAGAAGWKQNLRATAGDSNAVTGEGFSTRDTFYGTLEVDGWYTRAKLTMNFHVTYGHQEAASLTPDPVTGKLRAAEWVGGSVLVAYKLTPRLELALRGDYIWDQKNGGGLLDYVTNDLVTGVGNDGTHPNRGANRYEGSVGLGYAINANVTWKVEYRYDAADQKVFGNKVAIADALAGATTPSASARMVKDNQVAATSMVVSF